MLKLLTSKEAEAHFEHFLFSGYMGEGERQREMCSATAKKCPVKDYGLPAKVWANCLVRITILLGFFPHESYIDRIQQVCV